MGGQIGGQEALWDVRLRKHWQRAATGVQSSKAYMPYNIRIIPAREFLRLDAEGHLDLQTSRKLLSDAIWTCLRSKVGRVLIDVREVATTDMTAAHLCSLADVCREVSAPNEQDKIAILNRPKDEFNRAEFLASMAQGAGWNIMAFQDFEAAFDWLMS